MEPVIVAIHQPNFAPWLGYFHKMSTADVFVFLDDVQYSKNGFTNRVRIAGGKWLTVPVSASLGTPIDECRVADSAFIGRLAGQLRAAYGRSQVVADFIDVLVDIKSDRLVDVNLASIGFLAGRLGVTTRTIRSSELSVAGSSTQRLVNLVGSLGGTIYLSGAGGANYQEQEEFTNAGIELVYSNFEHPVYESKDGAFHPGLSALDFLVAQERPSGAQMSQRITSNVSANSAPI